MFRNIIKTVIQILDTLLKELKRAYDETYGNDELTKEFKRKVEEIKNENKEAFMRAAIKFEIINAIASRDYCHPDEITRRAERQFKKALDNGDLDELYNLQERSNNE